MPPWWAKMELTNHSTIVDKIINSRQILVLFQVFNKKVAENRLPQK